MEIVNDEEYIALICTGEFDAISKAKIGVLFENYFDNINYNVIKEDNDVFVDFTGDREIGGEIEHVVIRFIVYENVEEFEIYVVSVNNKFIDADETVDLLKQIASYSGFSFEGGEISSDDN